MWNATTYTCTRGPVHKIHGFGRGGGVYLRLACALSQPLGRLPQRDRHHPPGWGSIIDHSHRGRPHLLATAHWLVAWVSLFGAILEPPN